MQEPFRIEPDTRFIHEVIASGGKDLKKCMQCGTCSVVCTLAPDGSSFPRKQMLEAQWGLKETVVADPALWLCHNCGDCVAHCPRGARPGEVFGALRQQAIQHFAWPGFLGRVAGSPRYLLAVFALPGLIFWAIAQWSIKPEPTPAPEFAAVFPISVLEPLFFAVAGLVSIAFGIGIARFLEALRPSGATITAAALAAALAEIMTHARFSKCGVNRGRRVGHLLTFWGFVGLAGIGTAVGIGTMTGLMRTPLSMTSPWRLLANALAVVILAGSIMLLVDRLRRRSDTAGSAGSYFDWLFILTLTGIVLTGTLSEASRLAHAETVMFGVYSVHLVLIFSFFVFAPYSKFAHFAYRTVAIAASRRANVGAGRHTDS